MSIIFAIIFLTAYLATGVQVARMRYGLDYRRYEAISGTDSDNYAKIEKNNLEMSKMQHKSWCYLEWDLLADKGCDCDHKARWLELRSANKTLRAEGYLTPAEVSYSTLATWPLWFLGEYIKRLKPEHQIVKGEVVDVTDEVDEPALGWRSKIEADPMYIALTSEWDRIEATLAEDKASGKVKELKPSGRTSEDFDRYYRKVNRKIDHYISTNKGYK